MGKKIDSTIAKTNGTTPVKKAAARAGKTTAASVAVKPVKPTRAVKPLASKAAVIDAAEIARRAYFIGERRRNHGLRGDENQDWLDAERELLTEAKKPRKTSRA
jgi:hypothetical protein